MEGRSVDDDFLLVSLLWGFVGGDCIHSTTRNNDSREKKRCLFNEGSTDLEIVSNFLLCGTFATVLTTGSRESYD